MIVYENNICTPLAVCIRPCTPTPSILCFVKHTPYDVRTRLGLRLLVPGIDLLQCIVVR